MNKKFLSAAILACLAGTASGANNFIVLEENACISNASPNGKYVVGYHPLYNDQNVYVESFLYDAGTGKLDWLTSWDENDPAAGGQFSDVSDNGIMCGTSKDMDNIITWSDPMFGDEFSGPTQVATIWQDGERCPLPYGETDKNNFVQLCDGTFGLAISADGNKVLGNVAIGNGAQIMPCVWQRQTNQNWTMSYLALPDNATSVSLVAMSDDGNTIIANAYCDGKSAIVYWRNNELHVLYGPKKSDPEESVNISALAVSPNGRFIAMSYNFKALIYDLDNDTYRSFNSFEGSNMLSQNVVIDNSGNMYGTYVGYPMNRPFIYMYEADRLFDMSYYLSVMAPDMSPEVSFDHGSQVIFNAVSADGRHIFGNSSNMSGKGWCMELDAKELTIPFAPEISYAFSRNMNEVTLRWDADINKYDGYVLKAYNVYCDGGLVKSVDATTKTFDITLPQQSSGYHMYAVEAVFSGADNYSINSPKSNPVEVAVAANYDLPFMDDFEVSVSANYWTSSADYGDTSDLGWSCLIGAGLDSGSGLYSNVAGKTPYSFSFISRPMDATDEKFVSVSFGCIFALLNSPEQVLDKDFVSIDYSTDMGDNWTEIGSWSLAELSAGNWSFKTLDISDKVAGKLFLLRIHRHGEGVAQYMSAIDNFAVNTSADVRAPEGLSGTRTTGSALSMIWQSQSGCYNLNHLGNLRTMNMAFGNDGKEMIGANLFTPDDLAPYAGRYITSVSALINYFNYYEDVLGINATAVIFEDGKIVREQKFDEIVYNGYSVVNLDEPLLIDGTKELRVGIRIHDYDDWQWPAVAAVADDYIPGKTDLYTYDEGATWSNLSDLYDVADIQGHCLWDITAHITDTPECGDISYDVEPLLYNIQRDGSQLNVVAIDGNATRFIDNDSYDNAVYRVSAIAKDGSISGQSEPFINKPSGMLPVMVEKGSVNYDSNSKTVSVEEDAVRISVIDADGCLYRSAHGNKLSVEGLCSGIYIIAVEYADRTQSAKLIIR